MIEIFQVLGLLIFVIFVAAFGVAAFVIFGYSIYLGVDQSDDDEDNSRFAMLCRRVPTYSLMCWLFQPASRDR